MVLGWPATDHRGRAWACSGRSRSAAVLVALVVAPLVPVADLLNRDHGGLGNGNGAGGQFELTTVNPFIRLRRDLVAQTHTPAGLRRRPTRRETGYLRTTVLDQFRDDEWRPSPRDLPSENTADGPFPNPPGLGPGIGGTHERLEAAARSRLRHHLAAAALPDPRA